MHAFGGPDRPDVITTRRTTRAASGAFIRFNVKGSGVGVGLLLADCLGDKDDVEVVGRCQGHSGGNYPKLFYGTGAECQLFMAVM